MTCGIYSIRNTVNGRRYVGSSRTVEERWKNHRNLLERGAHHAPILQKAWKKYGSAAFVWEILEECELDALLVREQHFIDTLKAFGRRGYNALPEAGRPTYIPESVKAKMSVSNKALAARSPALCALRSEIAKRLHAEGRLGQAMWKPGTNKIVGQKNAAHHAEKRNAKRSSP